MSKKADGKRKTATNRHLTQMDPDAIYFTHARVRPVFTGCNKRIADTLAEVVAGTTRVEDIPYITVIENYEAVPDETAGNGNGNGKGKGKGGGGGGKKKSKRRGDSDDEDDAPAPTTGETRPFYFSLNNRRLYLFKTLKAQGVIDTIPVQVKPALERERVKYTRDRCVLRAKLMGAGQRPVGEEGGDEDVEEEDEEED